MLEVTREYRGGDQMVRIRDEQGYYILTWVNGKTHYVGEPTLWKYAPKNWFLV